MYEPLHYPQCIHLPSRQTNKTKPIMPMMTCYDRHKDDMYMLELLKRKESLILDQFKEHRYNNALRIIQLLHRKSEIKIQQQSHDKKKGMKSNHNHNHNHNHPIEKLNVVFIGDSMSKQSYFAFICELEYYGAIPIHINYNNDTAKHYIQNHRNYKDLINYDDSVVYNLDHNHYEHKYQINFTMFKHNDKTRIMLHTLFIWRNKGGAGSLLNDVYNNDYVNVNLHKEVSSNTSQQDNSKIIQPFLSLLTNYFNSRTLILYNEGLHHNSPDALYQSLKFPLNIFESLASDYGPFFLIRESNSVHFQVLNNNDTYQATDFTKKHCIRSIKNNAKKWRNQMIQIHLRRASRIIFFVPFYASTTIWEDDLHFFPDCLHPGCYTPFYWLSLFDTMFQVLILSDIKIINKWYTLSELYDNMYNKNKNTSNSYSKIMYDNRTDTNISHNNEERNKRI